ncbi:Uncharacterised protein [Vibrio cholerae]|nr:Uncharacterised protein [Vibrio cholerae]
MSQQALRHAHFLVENTLDSGRHMTARGKQHLSCTVN